MTTEIGHNGPPVDISIDWGRVLRWAILNSDLSPTASLIVHTIGALYDKDGNPVWPSIPWISEKSRIPFGTVKRYMREGGEVRGFRALQIERSRQHRGNTYAINISEQEVVDEYRAWQDCRQSVSTDPTARSVAAGSPSSPPETDRVRPAPLARSANDPAGAPPNVAAGSNNAAAGSPGRSATTLTKESLAGQASSKRESSSKVVSLRDDAPGLAIQRRREETFGPGLMPAAERLATFLRCNVNQALAQMDAEFTWCGPEAILRAIANLDTSGLDRQGIPIKNRLKWFKKGCEFAKADAGGDWNEAPKRVDKVPDKKQLDATIAAFEEARKEAGIK